MQKTIPLLRYFIVIVFAFLLTIPGVGQSEDPTPLEAVDTALSGLAKRNEFSGTVLVAHHGEIMLSQGYGYANLEWKIPNAPDTKFNIASLTKQFTAIAILKLQQDGLLDVQDTICQYLENCPDAWQEITIHQLLTHTSGMPDIPNLVDEISLISIVKLPLTNEQIVGLFIDLPLNFSPGTSHSYSNIGYHLLGLIIENVSEKSYQRYLRDTFFEPLGMENTGVDSRPKVIGNRAEGYDSLTGRTRSPYAEFRNFFSAGAIYSTVEDLYLWQNALYRGEIISQETLDTMLEQAPYIPDTNNYALYGLYLDTVDGRTRVSHSGSLPGFKAMMEYYPEEDLMIIILSNYEKVEIFDMLTQVILGAALES